MDYKNLLNKAQNMKYTFLFHSEEQSENFFKNLDTNIMIIDERVMLFIEKCCGVNSLYWAGEDLSEVTESLLKLKNNFKKGDIIQISYAQDKDSITSIDVVSEEFKQAGCKFKHHEIGYKTINLNYETIDSRNVEKAVYEDVSDIYKIMDNSLGAEKMKMDEYEIKSFINNDESDIFIIHEDGNIAGAIFVNIYDNKKGLFIRGLAVDEKYRGRGYSKLLMHKAFTYAKANGAVYSMLWVEKYNKAAISLYEKFGYAPYGDEEMMMEYVI